MIFILFGLWVAAVVGLVLGLLSPRWVPVPPPATRVLVAMIYGSFALAGGILLAALTRDFWAPARPVVTVSLPPPVTPPPPAPTPVVVPDPIPPPLPEPEPSASLPPPEPPPDPGPPPEPPTRFGPQALGQSAVRLQQSLTEQGVITAWEAETGPLGQAIQIGRGPALALFSESDGDRLYRVQVTTDLGTPLAELGPVARDTAQLQLGLLGLALTSISPEPELLRQESERVWKELLAALHDSPAQPRAARSLTIAGAALRLTLTQTGKASAQLVGAEGDLDPLLDVQP
ncbi:MAG: hypothetical protein ACOVKO_04770 [Elstera sp.]